MKETLCWIVWKSQYVIMFAIWLSQITLPRFQNALTDVCWESDKVWEVDKVDCTNIRQCWQRKKIIWQCWQRKKTSVNVDNEKTSDNVGKDKKHLTMLTKIFWRGLTWILFLWIEQIDKMIIIASWSKGRLRLPTTVKVLQQSLIITTIVSMNQKQRAAGFYQQPSGPAPLSL